MLLSFFKISRPQSSEEVLRRHLPAALAFGLILFLARLAPALLVPFKICLFQRFTGYPCPTCGWTRGFIAMAQGRWSTALHDCPFAIILFAVVVAVFFWNAAGLLSGRVIRRGPALKLELKTAVPIVFALLALATANWIYRLTLGLD